MDSIVGTDAFRIFSSASPGISELLYGEYPHLYWENMEQVFPHWTHYIPPEKRF